MRHTHKKNRTAKVFARKKVVTQIGKRLILQPPKIVTQAKIVSISLVIQEENLLPEKSMKQVEHVDPVAKPIAKEVFSEITPDHVKQVTGIAYVFDRSEP